VKTALQRFEEKIERIPWSGCWIWMGALSNSGYGEFRLSGKCVYAHRAAFALFVGPVGSLEVCHKCDVKSCVNPSHLFLGTHAENMRDAVAKGKAGGTKGEYSNTAKLKEADAFAIRNSHLTPTELAKKFGVSVPTICNLLAGRTWRHLLPPAAPRTADSSSG